MQNIQTTTTQEQEDFVKECLSLFLQVEYKNGMSILEKEEYDKLENEVTNLIMHGDNTERAYNGHYPNSNHGELFGRFGKFFWEQVRKRDSKKTETENADKQKEAFISECAKRFMEDNITRGSMWHDIENKSELRYRIVELFMRGSRTEKHWRDNYTNKRNEHFLFERFAIYAGKQIKKRESMLTDESAEFIENCWNEFIQKEIDNGRIMTPAELDREKQRFIWCLVNGHRTAKKYLLMYAKEDGGMEQIGGYSDMFEEFAEFYVSKKRTIIDDGLDNKANLPPDFYDSIYELPEGFAERLKHGDKDDKLIEAIHKQTNTQTVLLIMCERIRSIEAALLGGTLKTPARTTLEAQEKAAFEYHWGMLEHAAGLYIQEKKNQEQLNLSLTMQDFANIKYAYAEMIMSGVKTREDYYKYADKLQRLQGERDKIVIANAIADLYEEFVQVYNIILGIEKWEKGNER